MWVFLRNGTKVFWCFTFPSQLRPCGIDFKAAGGNPSKALQLLWPNHHRVREEHSEGTIMDTNLVWPRQACPLESYTEVLLKQPFFPSLIAETFLSVSSLTLNFPNEQKCPHCAYSPHPQPHSRACLKLPNVCQTGRGSACLQGGVPAHPRGSKTNREGRSWEQREAKQSWHCTALSLLLF